MLIKKIMKLLWKYGLIQKKFHFKIKTGVNKFSDLTRQEFAKTYFNLNYNAMAIQNFEPVDVKE